ncbi:MAG: hypothetical protein AAGU75_10505 [Bacillota bacterium]
MIKPILACKNPYETAKRFEAAGWKIDFSQPPESGDPLVGVSLYDNAFLLGITEGYVDEHRLPFVGCGVEFYITVPVADIHKVHDNHRAFSPTDVSVQPWGDIAFEVKIDGFEYMIAGKD